MNSFDLNDLKPGMIIKLLGTSRYGHEYVVPAWHFDAIVDSQVLGFPVMYVKSKIVTFVNVKKFDSGNKITLESRSLWIFLDNTGLWCTLQGHIGHFEIVV